MEEVDNVIDPVDNAIDPDNDISYGISNKGYEVMIVNDREIFLKRKIGKHVMIDHEEAMISALQNQLPDVHIHLCYFHVGQAIQRWVSQHGLQIYYNEENSSLKVFLGLIRALGLLPINDVMIGYQVILDSDHYQQIIIRGTELQLINNINSLTT